MLTVSFPGVVYHVPESPGALRRAIGLLQDRLGELERAAPGNGLRGEFTLSDSAEASPPHRQPRQRAAARPAQPMGATADDGPGQPSQAAGPANGNRQTGSGRWFVDRWPRARLATGEQVVFHSAEDLKFFLQQHGLSPHKRGDASMLLWQVRQRLNMPVDIVSRPDRAQGS